MNSAVLQLIGFIKASRIPNLTVIAVCQVFTSLFLLGLPLAQLLEIRFALLIVSTQMIAAAGYIINDYYDQKIDMINRPERVVVGVDFKRRQALLAHTFLSLAGFGVGFYLHWVIGLIHFFSAFFLWYYSNQLRRLPLIGNLVIAALAGMTFLIVTVFYFQYNRLVMIYAFFAFIIILLREIIKDVEDVKGEAAFGCTTIPVIWGINGAKTVIYVIILAGSWLLAYFLWDEQRLLLSLYFMSLLPVFMWFVYKLYQADSHRDFILLHQLVNWIVFTGIVSIVFIYG